MRFGPSCFSVVLALAATGCEGFDPAAGDLQAEKEKGRLFVESAARENGATQTASGLVLRTISRGNGDMPSATDRVTVHYTGRFADGSTFDSSVNRGPATFALQGVIRCWTEGLTMMRVGETAMLTCPSDLAYGDRGSGSAIPGGAVLQFEVELKGIEKTEKTVDP